MATPPSNLSQLQTAKQQILANLVSITANPKPTYSLDGQSVSWESYHSMLVTQLAAINDLIVIESGPFVFQTIGEV